MLNIHNNVITADKIAQLIKLHPLHQ